jgi:hypothetical protein
MSCNTRILERRFKISSVDLELFARAGLQRLAIGRRGKERLIFIPVLSGEQKKRLREFQNAQIARIFFDWQPRRIRNNFEPIDPPSRLT